MRVSFDLDGTLVCAPDVPAEPPLSTWRRWRCPEPLRRGTRDLARQLRDAGHEIWVYTTSYRSERYVRRWFRYHGVRLAGVVNQDRHHRVVGTRGPSKFPPAFGIDLHVDDSDGVGREGERHGFAVLVLAPDDPFWTDRVRDAVARRADTLRNRER